MKPTIYKTKDGYILATGESPKQFKDFLFVVWEGPIDGLTEGVKTRDELKKLERADEVPDKWIDAFADATGVCLDHLRGCDPTPEPERVRRSPRKTAPAQRDDAMDEFMMHCAVGTDPITAAVVSGVFDSPCEKTIPEFKFDPFWVAFDMFVGFLIYLYVFT